MTDDKHTKRAARALAAREGISYTAARRRLTAGPVDQEQRELLPPVAVPMVGNPCPEGCAGFGHPGTACWAWRPKDATGAASWEVRRAAELPGGRADQVMRRAEELREGTSSRWSRFHAWESRWLLALVYAMLTDQSPELRPDRAALRAAVESDDLAAVDAVMEPLDRAAARVLTKVPAQWWGKVKPRLDAYADKVEADTREPGTWREVEERQVVGSLVDQWRRTWVPVRNHNGYVDAPGVMWRSPKGWVDELLVAQHGGTLDRVRLADGRPATVYAAEWGEDGPPVAYRVRELLPGMHGNVGRLVPSITSDILVTAADCRPWGDG
ncbi:hypothetical protein ACWEBX_03150 [Streptomyces sp. NPDC005070]